MRSWMGWVAVGLMLMGCAHLQQAKKDEGDVATLARQPAYIDDVQGPAAIKAGEVLKLVVEGNLPTPAWRLADVTLTYPAPRRVEVVLWANLKDEGPAVQVLVPFTRDVEVPGLAAGKWQVAVRGHGDTGKTLSVEVR